MLGLERGTVRLLPHQEEWHRLAQDAAAQLKAILGETALDIQHVGSTAIATVHAKPIIDIAVGVRALEDVRPYMSKLAARGIAFRGEDVPGQLLFVMGDFERNTRTHHIHVVPLGGDAWNGYISFRDYLNAFPEEAKKYDAQKMRLAGLYASDRKRYTTGKQQLIAELLRQARLWKANPVQRR